MNYSEIESRLICTNIAPHNTFFKLADASSYIFVRMIAVIARLAATITFTCNLIRYDRVCTIPHR